jgi:nucleotide-binding universal stress UspA family protein
MKDIRTILVPVAGRLEDEEALEVACQMARCTGDVKIIVTNIISVDRSLPLDAEVETDIAKAEGVLARFENLGKKFGCNLETNLLQARLVAPAIVDEAVEQKADLIILGSAYKMRFGEFSLGDVVPYVLQNAPCHVILSHQPPLV